MHRLRRPGFVLSLAVLVIIGLTLYAPAGERSALAGLWGKKKQEEAAEKVGLTTQEYYAKLRDQNIDVDDSGIIFAGGGLTATYTGPEKLFPAYGKYGSLFSFLPLIRWYDPDHYYNSAEFHPESPVQGTFKSDECIVCHSIQTPGIVAQWRRSEHAGPSSGKPAVGCDGCHGSDHQKLTMPSYNKCGECHKS